MPKPKLIFGVHCHQPIGQTEQALEEAYQKAYLPFIQTVEKHPALKIVAHYSGPLFDWLKARHPEFLELLRQLVQKHKLELMSGGYYEPVLAVIPDQDKSGQIETMNRFLKEEFGLSPQGLFLTERVWEPTLPKILAGAGVEYTVLDDHHFTAAGLDSQKIDGYYITEDDGEKVKIFSASSHLRQLLPFEPPRKVCDFISQAGKELLIYLDDGEKLGYRDGSHNWVYGHGYLEKLLVELLPLVEFTTFADYLDEHEAKGRIYLPSDASFRNCLVKYPEANIMHKRMLFLSRRLHSVARSKILIGEEEKNDRLKQAITCLYKSQAHDAYCPGKTGGAFMPALRRAVYANLIEAEEELDKFSRGSRSFVELSVTDLDKDGRDEVMITNGTLSAFLSPARGGTIYELDYRPKKINLLNLLGRGCLVDHFLDLESNINRIREIGAFTDANFMFLPRRGANEVGVLLRQDGLAGDTPVRLEKNIHLTGRQSIINVDYQVTNLSAQEKEFWFCPEFNFGLMDKTLRERGEISGVTELKIIDELNSVNVSLEVTQGCLLWHFPIVTTSESESGSEKVFQGAALLPSWRFTLAPGGNWQVRISWRIEE